MFGFGITEIITIVIVALVLINPKDLPLLIRKIGKIYGTVMRQINSMRKTYSQFEDEVKTFGNLDKEFGNQGERK